MELDSVEYLNRGTYFQDYLPWCPTCGGFGWYWLVDDFRHCPRGLDAGHGRWYPQSRWRTQGDWAVTADVG